MPLRFCECNCGFRVTKVGNRFINHHSHRGKNHPMLGKKHSEESKEKMSMFHKSHPNSGVFQKGHEGEKNIHSGKGRILVINNCMKE